MDYVSQASPGWGHNPNTPRDEFGYLWNEQPQQLPIEIVGVGLSCAFLFEFLRSRKYKVADATCQLNIVGLRGASPSGKAGIAITKDPYKTHSEAVTNKNDDTIILCGKKGDGSEVLKLFSGSVDPGDYYTKNPNNTQGQLGCAHLKNGQYEYKLGTHKGSDKVPHEALVESGPVRIWRDVNKNGWRDVSDPSYERSDLGIHVHAGGRDLVGKNSAGCVNIAGGWSGTQWTSFLKMIKEGHDPMPILVTIEDAMALVNC